MDLKHLSQNKLLIQRNFHFSNIICFVSGLTVVSSLNDFETLQKKYKNSLQKLKKSKCLKTLDIKLWRSDPQ